MGRVRHGAVALGLVAALWAFAVEPAEAQGAGSSFDGLGALIAVPAVLVGGGVVALAVADVISFAAGTPFWTEWAIFEIVVGSLAIATGVVVLAAGIVSLNDGESFVLGLSAVPLALGALNLAHGIWSLESRGSAPPVTAFFAPVDGGAMAGLGGGF